RWRHLARACAAAARLVGLLLAALAAPARADAPFEFARTPGVLPKDIVPVEYSLRIAADPAQSTFGGRMTVAIDVRRPTAMIVMNALDLEIDAASLQGRHLRRRTLAAPVVDGERQTIAFALPAPLAPGRYALALAWHGRINVAAEGLYADRYRSADGAERVLLATDLEPTGARRVLPCWDEPSFRARFRLAVDLPAGAAAYSNMPAARRTTLPGGGRRIAFAATPKMASYLLALVAGDLERRTSRFEGTEVGVVTTRGKRGLTGYPLAASGTLLRYLNGYFGIRYPLPKLDHIALPSSFSGGMENWGAIVYNEAALLVDRQASAESARQRAFGLAAHEMAHQWFGNLVTMAWWDDLWLNEAFADWMAQKAVDRFHPEWQGRLRARTAIERAMALDARASTHPIRQPVVRDSEAEAAFDAITYDKGNGLLRMLEAYLGEAAFRDGIRAYLKRHRYSNSTGADLWSALARASSGKPVAAIAADWTTQPGFPLVDVDARCEDGRRTVLLRQQRFRVAAEAGAASERTWRIPIQLGAFDAGPGAYTLLRDRAAATVLDDGCRGTLVVDRDDVGFFRVRYAPPLFAALVARWPTLPDTARLKLLGDTSALVRADQLALARYVELLPGLRGEPRLALWEQFLRDLEVFDELSEGEPARAALHRFARETIAPRFAELGWDERAGETSEERQLRAR
ncbi:MAG: M1 family metallopeptidase, partial [Pseudomonadota bacterium]|nr:M1 family metallopeptidase [Pseudomonadota bacterium]